MKSPKKSVKTPRRGIVINTLSKQLQTKKEWLILPAVTTYSYNRLYPGKSRIINCKSTAWIPELGTQKIDVWTNGLFYPYRRNF